MPTEYKTIQIRRGTSAQWAANDRVLLAGELGCNTDTQEFKLGNGSTPWSALKVVVKGNIREIQSMTQAEYNALVTPDPLTLYAITDGAMSAAPTDYSLGAPLDSFSGVTDDDKLTEALIYQAAQTYVPPILLGNRAHTFTIQRPQGTRAMRLVGLPGFNNAEKGTPYMASRISLSGSSSWITSSQSLVYGLTLQNISFIGGSSATVLGGGSTIWWCDSLRDISCSGLKSFAGTQGTKRLMTACSWDGGRWDIGNSYSGAVHIGGSDNTLWPSGGLIDSGIGFATAGSANGQYHLWLDSLEKTFIGPIFVTAEGAWGGILVTGPAYGSTNDNLGSVQLVGAKIEGRSPTLASNGNVIRVSGGMLHASHCWIAYGMLNPSLTGHTPVDAGLVHVTGGGVSIRSTTFHKYSGQAETVPCVYQAGGIVRVGDIWSGSRTLAWTNQPGVKSVGGTLVNDGTMDVV